MTSSPYFRSAEHFHTFHIDYQASLSLEPQLSARIKNKVFFIYLFFSLWVAEWSIG